VVFIGSVPQTLEESPMLRFTAALLMIASSPVAPGADPTKKPDPAADLKALEGTWEVVSHEVKGKKASDAGHATPRKIVISAGKMDLDEKGEAARPIKIDPTRSPKAIDVYIPDAMKARAHLKGIYALKGDELRICLPLSFEAERPTRFSSEDFHSLYVLRRVK
jgi:uncharacterized protein (TIGR03067 family)